jgi:ferredoxin
MLDTAADRRPTSRLMCQIELRAELDGLEVFVARNES